VAAGEAVAADESPAVADSSKPAAPAHVAHAKPNSRRPRTQAVYVDPDDPNTLIIDHGDHKHRAHKMTSEEEFRALMTFLLVIAFMIGAQFAIHMWKRLHLRSFQQFTLAGLWAFPACISIYLHSWRFTSIWFAYSAVTLYFLRMATRKEISKNTPKAVYWWFLIVYKVAHAVGTVGYVMILCEIFGLRELFFLPSFVTSAAPLLLFYGLYFGVLVRDCAEMCTDQIHARMGYVRRKDDDERAGSYVPYNVCTLCGDELRPTVGEAEHDQEPEMRVFQLECKHEFHEFCIRGWTIVGKKDSCPTCCEKVSLKDVLGSSPWQSQSVMWAQLLDVLRYMVVWNPLILIAIQLTAKGTGLTS